MLEQVPDRSVSCRVTDLDAVLVGALGPRGLSDVRPVPGHDGSCDVQVAVASDDLVALVDRRLGAGAAWASGRLRVSAPWRDLLVVRRLGQG